MVPQRGLEPPTYGLGNRCSVQMSYWGVLRAREAAAGGGRLARGGMVQNRGGLGNQKRRGCGLIVAMRPNNGAPQ